MYLLCKLSLLSRQTFSIFFVTPDFSMLTQWSPSCSPDKALICSWAAHAPLVWRAEPVWPSDSQVLFNGLVSLSDLSYSLSTSINFCSSRLLHLITSSSCFQFLCWNNSRKASLADKSFSWPSISVSFLPFSRPVHTCSAPLCSLPSSLPSACPSLLNSSANPFRFVWSGFSTSTSADAPSDFPSLSCLAADPQLLRLWSSSSCVTSQVLFWGKKMCLHLFHLPSDSYILFCTSSGHLLVALSAHLNPLLTLHIPVLSFALRLTLWAASSFCSLSLSCFWLNHESSHCF